MDFDDLVITDEDIVYWSLCSNIGHRILDLLICVKTNEISDKSESYDMHISCDRWLLNNLSSGKMSFGRSGIIDTDIVIHLGRFKWYVSPLRQTKLYDACNKLILT